MRFTEKSLEHKKNANKNEYMYFTIRTATVERTDPFVQVNSLLVGVLNNEIVSFHESAAFDCVTTRAFHNEHTFVVCFFPFFCWFVLSLSFARFNHTTKTWYDVGAQISTHIVEIVWKIGWLRQRHRA